MTVAALAAAAAQLVTVVVAAALPVSTLKPRDLQVATVEIVAVVDQATEVVAVAVTVPRTALPPTPATTSRRGRW